MDAPVSPQGQNSDYENKSLEMVSMAKIYGCASMNYGKSVAASNYPN